MASHFHLSCQADPRPAVLLVGHSFVSRLEGALFSPNHPYCRPNFELEQCKVEFFGEGGWTVGDKPERLEHMQSKLRPVFRASRFAAVVIHLGDNDCCSPEFSPLGLASLLDDFAQWLVAEFGVRVVYVCQLFARPKPRYVSPEVYEQRRVKVNEYLETLLDTPIIKFWRHKRVTESPMAIFDRDGCHLNVIGMKKYYKSMRQAIFLAVEDVRNVCSS